MRHRDQSDPRRAELSVNGSWAHRLRAGLLVLLILAVLRSPPTLQARFYAPATQRTQAATVPSPATQVSDEPVGPLPWFSRFADALDASRTTGRPIFVDVGADWCVWCRELDKQIEAPAVQQRLRNWTRLRLDADRDGDTIQNLAVGPLPALRVLTANGQLVAWHNGYMKAEELAAWLDPHVSQLPAAPLTDLDSSGVPNEVLLPLIIERLSDRDSLIHEAAVRRLLSYPNEAAEKVVTAFINGNLRQRLASRELLVAWKAPVQALDPWNPKSVGPPAIEALRRWASQKHEPPSAAAVLSTEDLAIIGHGVDVILQTADPSELESARERLARFGPSLLPEVYAALKSAVTDRDRERLTALRYRAVASEALALRWSGGFDRIASTDAQVRHLALDELGKHVTANDAPLLLELFSDPDPLVRETSLRLLETIGGGGSAAGLVRLLHDPEANVRAAVLKQFALTPDPAMVPEVVEYLATEKDPDLVVHAIRFLREVKGKGARDCLLSLLGSDSWRVRAEAAEALGDFVPRYSSPSSKARESQADIYAAMIKLLNDSDGFVVSRALGVLQNAQVPTAIKAIVKVAERRPELALDVVKTLGSQSNDNTAQAALRRFCSHHDAAVRAAALTALGSSATGDELLPALNDAVPHVRLAAAAIVEEQLEEQRPDHKSNGSPESSAIDWEEWLRKFRAGRGRPDWAAAVVPPLRKMFSSNEPKEKLAAAVPLVALGDQPDATRFLHEAVGALPAERRNVAAALQWLPSDQRLALFNELKAASGGDSQMLSVLAVDLASTPSSKTADALWDLLNDRAADISVASQVERALIRSYTGREYWYFESGAGPGAKALADAAGRKASDGSANQRLVALALQLKASPEDAASSAAALLGSGAAGEGLETAALQVLLLAQPRQVGVKTAIARLAASGPLRKIALAYLAAGAEPIRTIQGELYLDNTNQSIEFRTLSEATPIVIEPPTDVTAQMLHPLLTDPDPETVAYASYLLCLLGERAGLDAVIACWRGHRDDDTWRRLAYRAVSVIGDDQLTPVLDEIYSTYDKRNPYEVRDFYRTIRVMKGEQVLKLRKRIRDEVGMQQLR